MSHDSTIAPSCKDSRTFRSRVRDLLLAGSRAPQQITSNLSTRLASLAAFALITASTGLGGYYAWSVGEHHGSFVAALFVCFAVGLELCKPLAFSATFEAFRSWSPVRGIALGLLALVAVAYSLTAELSLMATSRSDAVAQREAAVKAASNIEAAALRASEQYERAKSEFANLPAARPAAELQSEIDALLLRPGTNGCVAIDGKVTREVCPKVAELRTEKARAERRAQLAQTLAAPVLANTVNTSQQAVSKSDPAAAALAAYLALLGFVVAPALLSEWFVLIPVLALEIGSTLSVLLVQSISPAPGVTGTRTVSNRKREHSQQVEPEPVVQVVQACKDSGSEVPGTALEDVKNRVLVELKAAGGSKVASERGLAKLIGTSKPTARRALQSLVMAGVVAAEAGRNGTLLRLVA